jgi:hypothetical protein
MPQRVLVTVLPERQGHAGAVHPDCLAISSSCVAVRLLRNLSDALGQSVALFLVQASRPPPFANMNYGLPCQRTHQTGGSAQQCCRCLVAVGRPCAVVPSLCEAFAQHMCTQRTNDHWLAPHTCLRLSFLSPLISLPPVSPWRPTE